MIQQGTLVGAPIRVNDSNDTYPSAIDNEIKGGRYSLPSTNERDAIPAARRSAGMECYCIADGNTYELANDLVTWSLSHGAAGGTTAPGSGGSAADIILLSGNFGPWTPLTGLSSQMINTNFVLSFKSDLQAFPTRAITYIQGQFGLNGAFAGTTLLLGTLPVNSRPATQILKYFICQNIEMFLQVDTNGNVSLVSKDGINLPTTSGTPEVQPYYLDLFFNPLIGDYTPTVYSYTRSETFIRNDCGTGNSGTTVTYNQTYTSTIDLATATNNANTDPNYEANGQAYANSTGTCSVDPVNNAFVVNNRNAGNQVVIFTDSHGTQTTIGGTYPGGTGQAILNPAETYTVTVHNTYGPGLNVLIDNAGFNTFVPSGTSHDFPGLNPAITVTLSD